MIVCVVLLCGLICGLAPKSSLLQQGMNGVLRQVSVEVRSDRFPLLASYFSDKVKSEVLRCMEEVSKSYTIENKNDDGYQGMLLMLPKVMNLRKKSRKQFFTKHPIQIAGGGIATSTYVLSFYEDTKTLVLAFRGVNLFDPDSVATLSRIQWIAPDWLKDSCPEARIQKGYNQLLLDILQDEESLIKQIKKALLQYQVSKIMLTGHSQGGGIVSYLAPYLALHFRSNQIDCPIGVITFAAPRIGNLAFREFLNTFQFDPFFCITMYADTVAYFPCAPQEREVCLNQTIRSFSISFLMWGFEYTGEFEDIIPYHPVPNAYLLERKIKEGQKGETEVVVLNDLQYSQVGAFKDMLKKYTTQSFKKILVEDHIHSRIALMLRRHLKSANQKYEEVKLSQVKTIAECLTYLSLIAYRWVRVWNQSYWESQAFRPLLKMDGSIAVLNGLINGMSESSQLVLSSNRVVWGEINLFSLTILASIFQRIYDTMIFLPASPWAKTLTFSTLLIALGWCSPQLFLFHFIFSVYLERSHQWLSKVCLAEHWGIHFLIKSLLALTYQYQLFSLWDEIPVPSVLTWSIVASWYMYILYTIYSDAGEGLNSEDELSEPYIYEIQESANEEELEDEENQSDNEESVSHLGSTILDNEPILLCFKRTDSNANLTRSA